MGIDESRKRSLIKGRQETARPLVKMAKEVALELGERHPKKHGAYRIFRDIENDLYISYDDYAPNLEVFYMGTKVLNIHLGSITGYIPDIRWERILREHHSEAAKTIAKKKSELAGRKARELHTKWDIAPEAWRASETDVKQ